MYLWSFFCLKVKVCSYFVEIHNGCLLSESQTAHTYTVWGRCTIFRFLKCIETTALYSITMTWPPGYAKTRPKHEFLSCCSTLTAEPHSTVALGLQQDHGWRSWANRREFAKTAESGLVVVPADNRRGSGVHRMRFEPAGGTDTRQVGASMLGDCKWRGVKWRPWQQEQKWGIQREGEEPTGGYKAYD